MEPTLCYNQVKIDIFYVYNDEAAHVAVDVSGGGLSVQIYAPGRCAESPDRCKDCTDGVFSKGTFKVRLWPLYQS